MDVGGESSASSGFGVSKGGGGWLHEWGWGACTSGAGDLHECEGERGGFIDLLVGVHVGRTGTAQTQGSCLLVGVDIGRSSIDD